MSSPETTEAEPRGHEAVPPFRPGLLALFSILSVLTLAAGGWLTSLGLGPWYDELQKPPFQPPAWVFTPAWTTIFALLAIATWRLARQGNPAKPALFVYGVQLVLNMLWSLFFFAMERPDLALVEICVLDIVIVVMVVMYGRLDRTAGWFLVPYGIWLVLATSINLWVVLNN